MSVVFLFFSGPACHRYVTACSLAGQWSIMAEILDFNKRFIVLAVHSLFFHSCGVERTKYVCDAHFHWQLTVQPRIIQALFQHNHVASVLHTSRVSMHLSHFCAYFAISGTTTRHFFLANLCCDQFCCCFSLCSDCVPGSVCQTYGQEASASKEHADCWDAWSRHCYRFW